MITKITNTMTARQISGLNTPRASSGRGSCGRGNYRGRGERGRVFYRGRGGRFTLTRYGSRGGSGREGNNLDGSSESHGCSLTWSYSPEEWSQLTLSQRSRVYRESDRMQAVRAIASVTWEEIQSARNLALTNDVSMITVSMNANQVNNDNQNRSQKFNIKYF